MRPPFCNKEPSLANGFEGAVSQTTLRQLQGRQQVGGKRPMYSWPDHPINGIRIRGPRMHLRRAWIDLDSFCPGPASPNWARFESWGFLVPEKALQWSSFANICHGKKVSKPWMKNKRFASCVKCHWLLNEAKQRSAVLESFATVPDNEMVCHRFIGLGRLQSMMTSHCEGDKMSIVARFLKDLTVHCYLSSRCLLELQDCVKNINGKFNYCSVCRACRACRA